MTKGPLMRIAALLLLGLFLSGGVRAQDLPPAEVFEDWRVTCLADGYCAAATRSPAGDELSIGRHAQQSYWEMRFTPSTPPAQEASLGARVDEGEPVDFRGPAEVGAYGSAGDLYLLSAKAQAIMDQMTPGSTLTLAYAAQAGGVRDVEFSLNGFSPALFSIDQLQGRVGSERVAEVPPYGLAPVGSGGAVAEVPQALLDRHRGDPDCSPLEELPQGRELVAAGLDATHNLYIVPCWTNGENHGAKVYLGIGQSLVPQYFAAFGGELGWMGTPYLVNPSFDAASKTLRDKLRPSPEGNCGTAGTWRWTGSGFRLEEFRFRDCADPAAEGEGADAEYPVIYGAPASAAAGN